MKTHFVLSAAAASICLSSCVTDPSLAAKKKSTSIGRFGVTHTTSVDPQAAPAPSPPAPVTESVATVTPAPAPEAASAPQRKALFDWNPKKKEEPTVAAAPAPVEKPAPAPAPAPAKKNLFEKWGKKKEPKVEEAVAAAPAPAEKIAPAPAAKPEKKNLFANWGRKKEQQAASSPPPVPTASAPSKKKNVSIGRFGVTYVKSDEQVAAAPAPVQEAAPAPEKKSRFSWFKRKNDTQDAPVAVKIDEKPAEKAEKKEKSVSKPRIARADEPVEFKERGKSGGLSGDIRLPEMLNLPEGKDLKSSGSGTKKTGKEGSVISRPPVEEKKD